MKRKQNLIEIEIKMLMENQKASIKFYTIFTAILWAVGIGLVMFVYLNKNPKGDYKIFESIMSACATLIAALSAVPLKEIIAKREKLAAYRIVNRHIEEMNSDENKINDKEYQKMRELVWKIVENTTLA